MSTNRQILALAGDGIGPEVMREGIKVLRWLDSHKIASLDIVDGVVGGAAFDKHGVPLAEETLDQARRSDAILLGAVGGPKWENLPYHLRPERGLLELRKKLDLFANLRPAMMFDPLVDSSTLKPEVIRGVDMMIVRELTGGVYFGEPRGITRNPDGSRTGVNTHRYHDVEIIRVGRVAFELARKRRNNVVSVDKSNVMEAGLLWREEIQKLHDADFPDVELSHMYADNCAMQLVRKPRQFDVIVTDNLFGDVLSDCAAMCCGSLGMLPSASLGPELGEGRRLALYEPIHGSAPDIAGQERANPVACILSAAMMLRHSLDMEHAAALIERSVAKVLADGIRTADIAESPENSATTADMGAAIIKELDRQYRK